MLACYDSDMSSADFKDLKKRTWRGNRLAKLALYNNMEVPRPGKMLASVSVDWPPTGGSE